jgi:hypothetical protein
MIIFGWKPTVKELAALFTRCRSCGMQGWQRIYRTMTWFTLFFLPVLPLMVSRAVICGTCGTRTRLTRAESDALVAQAHSHIQHPAYGQHPTAHA